MSQKELRTRIVLAVIAVFIGAPVYAQVNGSGQDEIEALYDQFDAEGEQKSRRKRPRQKRDQRIEGLSELATLSPFEDIAVIQRRFLPKTGRFEFSTKATTGLNNPFFNNLGLSFKGAYYFKERYSLELSYLLFSPSKREVTESLETERNVATETLVSADSYMGLDFKWSPIYGKMTFLNETIVPFDLYFAAGGGLTKTDIGQNEPTVHVGTGQIFALSKALALRWDFSWNFYQATSGPEPDAEKANQDELLLSLGLSFFFPEASYR